MVNPSSDSYRNPLRYQGQDYSFAPIYRRERDPRTPTNASPDIKPKEQQGYYPISSFWSNSVNGNLWVLANISNNLAHWILIGSTADNPILNVVGDDGVEVDPDAGGTLTVNGVVVANTTNAKAVYTKTGGASIENIEVQYSAAIASTDGTKVGLSAFSNTQFSVDANGFVSLLGGALPAIQKVVVQTPGNGVAGSYTYTPTTNMKYCIVELVGGGGGAGGVAATDAVTAAAAAGGGGGGYARRLLSAAQIGVSQVVTIGAGGTGGAAGNNNGAAGGTTSLGALLSATGGLGGQGTAGATVTSSTAGGTSGGSGSTGDLNINGSNSEGGHVWFNAASFAFGLSGDGGDSFFGPTVTGGSGNNNGANGSLGSGGSGATANINNATGQSGGNGGDGFMIITEFCS